MLVLSAQNGCSAAVGQIQPYVLVTLHQVVVDRRNRGGFRSAVAAAGSERYRSRVEVVISSCSIDVHGGDAERRGVLQSDTGRNVQIHNDIVATCVFPGAAGSQSKLDGSQIRVLNRDGVTVLSAQNGCSAAVGQIQPYVLVTLHQVVVDRRNRGVFRSAVAAAGSETLQKLC